MKKETKVSLRHVATVHDVFFIPNVPPKVVQQFDDHANHRLMIGTETSPWSVYQSISCIEFHGADGKVTIYGTSDYYSGKMPRVFAAIPGVQKKGAAS